MSASSQQLAPGLFAAATHQLQLAYGQLLLPDWQDHSAAIPAAVDGLTQLYLHVDATTGAYDPRPIYLDTTRAVLGMMPRAVEPLVKLLELQTKLLDMALERGWTLPPAEAPAWAHWRNRLTRYRASLDRALTRPTTPSEALWDEVTSPLLQGLYPADFASLGIANPSSPSKPDMGTVPTTAFMVALQAQETDGLQTWLLTWREAIGDWFGQMEQALNELSTRIQHARSQAKRGLRWLGFGLAIGVVGLGAWALTRD